MPCGRFGGGGGGHVPLLPPPPPLGSGTEYATSSFISSPEHEVLMVSYCDQSLSVVRALSTFALNDFSTKMARRILK